MLQCNKKSPIAGDFLLLYMFQRGLTFTCSKQVLRLQRKLRCNLPLGCYQYRGSPSSQRVQELKKNLQIERQSAYGPMYRS